MLPGSPDQQPVARNQLPPADPPADATSAQNSNSDHTESLGRNAAQPTHSSTPNGTPPPETPPYALRKGHGSAQAQRAFGLTSPSPSLVYGPTDRVVAHGAQEVTQYLKALPSGFDGNGDSPHGRCTVAEAAAAGATDKLTAEIKKRLDTATPREARSDAEQQASILAEGFLAAACLTTKRVLAQVFSQAAADMRHAAERRIATSCAQVTMLQVCPGAGDSLLVHQMAPLDLESEEQGPAAAAAGDSSAHRDATDDSDSDSSRE